jgi:cysteinyl-tRNA synthetase
VEVWCGVQALSIAGEKMSKSDKVSASLQQVLKQLGKWGNDSALEARIRFKIKDLQVRPAALHAPECTQTVTTFVPHVCSTFIPHVCTTHPRRSEPELHTAF